MLKAKRLKAKCLKAKCKKIKSLKTFNLIIKGKLKQCISKLKRK